VPVVTTPGGGVITPGKLPPTPSSAAAAGAALSVTPSAKRQQQQRDGALASAQQAQKTAQRKLLLFSPVRAGAGAAALPSANAALGGAASMQLTAASASTAAGTPAAAAAGVPWGGSSSNLNQKQQQTAGSSFGSPALASSAAVSTPAAGSSSSSSSRAYAGGSSSGLQPQQLMTPQGSRLPRTPSAGLNAPSGSAFGLSPNPRALPTPSRRPQQGAAASGSLFNSWASNVVTAGNNQDTVSGVIDLLTGNVPGGDGMNSAAGVGFSAARNSSRAFCSSSDSDSDSGEIWGPAASVQPSPGAAAVRKGSGTARAAARSAGGYFTPIRRPSFEMQTAGSGSGSGLVGLSGFSGLSPGLNAAPAAAATAAAAGFNLGQSAGTPTASSLQQPMARFSPAGPAAGSLLVGGYDFEVSDDEDDTMVTRAGKSISGALFAAPEGLGVSRTGLGSFTGLSSAGVATIPSLLMQQRLGSAAIGGIASASPAAARLPFGTGGAYAASPAACSSSLGLQQLRPLVTGCGFAVTAQLGDDLEEVHTPVHGPIHSPTGSSTPPDQIMHSMGHASAWSSPGSNTHSSSITGAVQHTSIASLHTAHNSGSGALPDISSAAGSPAAAGGPPGVLLQPPQLQRQGSLRFEPPRAPARPTPSVMLVPACDAPEIAMSMEGLQVD
jgi:hypothetical protein